MRESIQQNGIGKINPLTIFSSNCVDSEETIKTVLHGVMDVKLKNYYDETKLKEVSDTIKIDSLSSDAEAYANSIFTDGALRYMADIKETIKVIDGEIIKFKTNDFIISDTKDISDELLNVAADPVLNERLEHVIDLMVDCKVSMAKGVYENPLDHSIIVPMLDFPSRINFTISNLTTMLKEDENVVTNMLDDIVSFTTTIKQTIADGITTLDLERNIDDVSSMSAVEFAKYINSSIEDASYSSKTIVGKIEEYKAVDTDLVLDDIIANVNVGLETKNVDKLVLSSKIIKFIVDVKILEHMFIEKIISKFRKSLNAHNEMTDSFKKIILKTNVY